MAGFDPDSYLAQTEAPKASGFDPDAYLGTLPSTTKKPSRKLEAGLEAFGKEASFGYLPELQAAAEPYITKGLNFLTGNDVQVEPDFNKRKGEFVKRGKELSEAEPVASTVGMLGGALSTPIPGLGVGGGLLKTAAKGAASGAITGAAYNPYSESEETGLGLGERGSQALKGGLLGGAASSIAPALSKAGKAVGEASDLLAIKTIGPFKKEMKNLINRNKYEDVAKFVKDKYAKTGASPETIFEKSTADLDVVGKKIGSAYQGVQKKISDPKFVESLTPDQAKKLREIDEEGINIAFNLLGDIEAKFASKPGGAGAVSFIEKTVAEPLSRIGNNLQELMRFRSQVDDLVKWSSRSQEMPVNQEALVTARNAIQKSIDDRIKYLDEVAGGSEMETLKKLNKEYGLTATVKEIAGNRAMALKSNMSLGLPELIVGTGYGGMSGGFTPEGIAKGLLGAAAVRGARTLGPGAITKPVGLLGKGLEKAGKKAEKLKPGQLGRLAGGNNE